MLYSDCDKKLIDDFEKYDSKVFLYLTGIAQYDMSNKLVNTYSSKYDCAIANSMADRTLNNILDKNILHNSSTYKSLGSKTQWIK
jgi:hypothetical protein